ncbi:DNA/RNA polymerase [Lindgomyces ingoldianus]|uniref:DNA/RNA polymerase n=1 Tax=Lindgomyces ingoldianus TaxID=673940 RepID=A0ACB6QWL3_9PLEO|nr:DNA/RNA polymerase [Lindgomyces ingoldianus]KAF2470586.1 DNA/RNA polymerase [Lindgomyces ingoldianus]
MDSIPRRRRLIKRQLDSIIIHFDCFYASVFEAETPALKSVPLAVQQKQIVVTCNYEARRRGLHKLQLITDAKRICPDVVIVLGEDLTRFRNASKELYAFLKNFSWNSKVERLGFDEASKPFLFSQQIPYVFMDVSDIVDYNLGLVSQHDLETSFFCLSKNDPTAGFTFDASQCAGRTYPDGDGSNDKLCVDASQFGTDALRLRLHLGSHLAEHLRHQLHSQKGYTCTVGVSTNKLLSKLVGSLHKPDDQTTLLPPYVPNPDTDHLDNVTSFIDGHEIGKIPGIGFKLAQKLRAHVLGKPLESDTGLMYGGTKEKVLVADVRNHPGISVDMLEQVLGGPSTPHGIGVKIWSLINGSDDTEVGQAREVPKQISIEDSYYIRLNTLEEVTKELRVLAISLLKRMHADLLEEKEDQGQENLEASAFSASFTDGAAKRWLAFPKTLRLSTRPRTPQNHDGSRSRSFARISRSSPMPNFIFSLKENSDALAERLVSETLIPLFRKLHHEKSGWNLSLVNIAATNMVAAASGKGGVGRDISKMFKQQDNVLKQWRIEDEEADSVKRELDLAERGTGTQAVEAVGGMEGGSEDIPTRSQDQVAEGDTWEPDEEDNMNETFRCDQCGAIMPLFAMVAHDRWHFHGSVFR